MEPISTELSRRLTAEGRLRKLKRGERIVHEGLTHGAVILVLSGTLQVVGSTIDGDELVLALRGPGEMVGDLSPLTGGTANATVVAREPGEIVVIASNRFVDLVRDDPAITFEMLQRVIGMFNETERRRVVWMTSSPAQRVLDEIRRIWEMGGSSDRIDVTQVELAGLSGTARGAVSSLVGELRASGVVASRRGALEVLDADALRSFPASRLTPAPRPAVDPEFPGARPA